MLGLLFLLIVLKRDIVHNRALVRNDLNALVRLMHILQEYKDSFVYCNGMFLFRRVCV